MTSQQTPSATFGDRVRVALFLSGVALRLSLRVWPWRLVRIVRELRSNIVEAAAASSTKEALRGIGSQRRLVDDYLSGVRSPIDVSFGLVGALTALLVFYDLLDANFVSYARGMVSHGGWTQATLFGSYFNLDAAIEGHEVLFGVTFPKRLTVVVVLVGFVVGSQMWRLARLRRSFSAVASAAIVVVVCGLFSYSGLASGSSWERGSIATLDRANLGLAGNAVLNPADVPSGWKGAESRGASYKNEYHQPRTKDDDRYDVCLGRSALPSGTFAGWSNFGPMPSHPGRVGSALTTSEDFEVTSSSTLFANADDARMQVATLQNDRYLACLRTYSTDDALIEGGKRVGTQTYTVSPISAFTLNNNEVGYREVDTNKYDNGSVVTVVKDVITLHNGRMTSQIVFTTYGDGALPTQSQRWLDIVRMRTQASALMIDSRA